MKKIKFILTVFFALIFQSKEHLAARFAEFKAGDAGGNARHFPQLAEILAEEARALQRKIMLSIFRKNRWKDCRGLIILTLLFVKRFPDTWSGFNDFIVPAIAYLNTNKVRLELIAADLDALNLLLNDPATGWIFVYGNVTDSSTNSKNWRDRRDILRNAIVLNMNTMEDGIRQSLLTVEDRNALHLPAPNHTHTPVIKMPVAPTLTMETITHLQHIIRLKNPMTPASDAMPYGQHIILEYFIGPAGLTIDKITFTDVKTVTTFLYGVAFDPIQAGQTIYYQACYENRRGKRSVWSALLSQVIA